jgi:hypothetical protein
MARGTFQRHFFCPAPPPLSIYLSPRCPPFPSSAWGSHICRLSVSGSRCTDMTLTVTPPIAPQPVWYAPPSAPLAPPQSIWYGLEPVGYVPQPSGYLPQNYRVRNVAHYQTWRAHQEISHIIIFVCRLYVCDTMKMLTKNKEKIMQRKIHLAFPREQFKIDKL